MLSLSQYSVNALIDIHTETQHTCASLTRLFVCVYIVLFAIGIYVLLFVFWVFSQYLWQIIQYSNEFLKEIKRDMDLFWDRNELPVNETPDTNVIHGERCERNTGSIFIPATGL